MTTQEPMLVAGDTLFVWPTKGSLAIVNERERQISEEYFTAQHDADLPVDDLAKAAWCYLEAALGNDAYHSWPFDPSAFKPRDRRANLIRAGALIAAAIDADNAREA